MRRAFASWIVVVAFVAIESGGLAVAADDLLPPDKSIQEAFDHYVDARLNQQGVQAAAPAGDGNLIRRLTLDLAGRIPTAAEARAYVQSTDPDKLSKLVDRLMSSSEFARHQVQELDAMLMNGNRGSLERYLKLAVAENRPWDRIFRELLTDEPDAKESPARDFMRPRVKDIDQLTTDVSVLFFGVNISCAKCHDHPLVDAWKQDHFYGMKSFFARTFEYGEFVAERDFGDVKFTTTEGEEKQAKLMFLTGTVFDEPQGATLSDKEQKELEKRLKDEQKKKQPPPPPKFSRRAKLVELALATEQRAFFARSIVNRLVYRFYGRGLVMPVDQMHTSNPASHPALLDWLARDLIDHGYDLQRLIRGLALSKAYARSSRWENGPRPNADLFAVAQVRPLTPHQYAASLRLANADPNTLAADVSADEFQKRIDSLVGASRGFASSIEQPHDGFQISVAEALLLSNSDRVVRNFLSDGGGSLIGRLKGIKDAREAIVLAYWNALSREPDAEELTALAEFVARRADRPLQAYQQMLWAVVTSSEFRFNY